MDLSFFTANLGNPAALIPAIYKQWKTYYEWKAFKEYYTTEHKVLDTAYRKDRVVDKETQSDDGRTVKSQSIEEVNRIPLAYQRLIVSRSVAFASGGGLELKSDDEDSEVTKRALKAIKSTFKGNKIESKNADIARRLMSETECCEIWYSKVDPITNKIEMRCNIYSPSTGSDLIPIWDENGTMISFARGFKVTDEVTKRNIRHLHLYTATELRKFIEGDNGWEQVELTPLKYDKIPVVYYWQYQTAWADVQWIIERLEDLLSNLGDINDYNGSPILLMIGQIVGQATKGQSGKALQLEGQGADVRYVTWDAAPESMKLEIETLERLLYTLTQTPNISFDQMQGLGGLSGVAFDRVMIDAHLKAKDFQMGAYGEGIQRRINFLLYALASIDSSLTAAKDMDITPVFSLFSVDNTEEKIATAMQANGNKPVMTHEQSVKYAGTSDDAAATVAQIVAETATPDSTNTSGAGGENGDNT